MSKTASRRRASPKKGGRKQFANTDFSALAKQNYPSAPPPTGGGPDPYAPPQPGKLVDLRTQGESSISTARVTQSVRMRFNPLRNLTPEGLASYLDQFDLGFFRQAAVVWDRLEKRDYKLKTVIPKRKKAVARHGYDILTVDKIPAGQEQLAEKQAAALTHFYNNVSATDALKPDQTGGLSLLVRQMMDAQGKYYAVHETVYIPSPEGLTAQFVFCPLWWFEGTTGKLRYMDSEFQVYGRDMLPGEWLVTCGEGLMEASSVAWMFKHLSLQDWMNFCERYGQPFIDAATSASPDSPEWDALTQYVTDMRGDGAGVRSQSATINLVESKSAGGEIYDKMVQNMDRALTQIWRGGDLGTQGGKQGAVGASLQEDETDILESDDASIIEETLATQASRFVINYTFGPGTPVLAYLKFRSAEKANTAQDLLVDQFLLDAGAPLAVKQTLERYGRPVPEEGDELLSKPAAPAVKLPGAGDPGFANSAEGVKALAEAQGEDFDQLRHLLQSIEGITDDKLFEQKLRELIADHGPLIHALANMNAYPKAAKTLNDLITAHLAKALTTPPKS